MVDKVSLENIQDFKIFFGTATDGQTYHARGASGWYFQASASTSQVALNDVTQDERDLQAHLGWDNILNYWANGQNPPNNGQDFKGFDFLFLGTPTFGGYYYGTRDPDVYPGDWKFPQHIASEGPIRMSYLYGDTNPALNNDMQFQTINKCKAQLVGTTPAIPNWSSQGSAIPDSDNAKFTLKVGTDALIPIDGLRAIRIRILGWHAHMADHAVPQYKIYPSATFPSGMNYVWRENSGAFYCEGGQCYGDFTPQVTYNNQGNPVYGSAIELTGFHHFKFGEWADNTLGAPARYQIKATAKVWYRNADHSMPSRPDPHKVVMSTGMRIPDEILEVQATERKTVHTAGDPLFNVDPDYAKNVGFVFNFSKNVTEIAYLHIEWHYLDQLIGSQFWGGRQNNYPDIFPCVENYYNTIMFTKKQTTDVVCDNMSASLVCFPFGPSVLSPLPLNGLAITQVGSAGTAYTFVPYSYTPQDGLFRVRVDWGDDALLQTVTLGTAVQHTYANPGIYTLEMTVEYTEQSGREAESSKMYITVKS